MIEEELEPDNLNESNVSEAVATLQDIFSKPVAASPKIEETINKIGEVKDKLQDDFAVLDEAIENMD